MILRTLKMWETVRDRGWSTNGPPEVRQGDGKQPKLKRAFFSKLRFPCPIHSHTIYLFISLTHSSTCSTRYYIWIINNYSMLFILFLWVDVVGRRLFGEVGRNGAAMICTENTAILPAKSHDPIGSGYEYCHHQAISRLFQIYPATHSSYGILLLRPSILLHKLW